MPYSARVLVICGEEKPRDDLCATLEARGYETLSADSRQAALHQARSHHPDVAVIRPGAGDVTADMAEELAVHLKSIDSVIRYPVILLGDRSAASINIEARIAYAYHDMQLFNRIESLVRLDTMGRELKRRIKTLSSFGVTDLEPFDPPVDLKNLKILIAGNPNTAFSQIESILDHNSTEIIAAPKTSLALDYLNADAFDAVILNIDGNAADLLTLSETMRHNPRLYNLPVIAVSDLTTLGPPEEAYRDGVTDILSLPLNEQELKNRVETLVREARFRNALQDVYAHSRHTFTNDALTGLFTYGFLRAHIEKVVEDSIRTNQDLSVAFFDIQSMKTINDTHGFGLGDSIIRQTGSMLGMLVRGEDIPARYTGAEFALVLPNTSYDIAQTVTQRVTGVINNTLFPSGQEDEAISVILKTGLAALWPGETGASLLIKARREAKSA